MTLPLPLFTHWCNSDLDHVAGGPVAGQRDHRAGEKGPSDQELVERITASNALAFETLFVRYAASLATFSYRFVESRDGAHDVVHDIFARIWKNRAQLHIAGSVRGYLYAAARNRALHAVEHRAVESRAAEVFLQHEERLGMGSGAESLAESPEEQVLRAEVAAAIRAAFEEVPPRARLIAVMRWQDGLGRQEIAEALGIAVGTVNKQLTLAARALRSRLKMLRVNS